MSKTVRDMSKVTTNENRTMHMQIWEATTSVCENIMQTVIVVRCYC